MTFYAISFNADADTVEPEGACGRNHIGGHMAIIILRRHVAVIILGGGRGTLA